VGVVVVGGERVPIRPSQAALHAPFMVARIHGAILPRPVVGHRAFGGQEPLVAIGNDEEERRRLPRSWHLDAAKKRDPPWQGAPARHNPGRGINTYPEPTP
jgi:hypothetical protein